MLLKSTSYRAWRQRIGGVQATYAVVLQEHNLMVSGSWCSANTWKHIADLLGIFWCHKTVLVTQIAETASTETFQWSFRSGGVWLSPRTSPNCIRAAAFKQIARVFVNTFVGCLISNRSATVLAPKHHDHNCNDVNHLTWLHVRSWNCTGCKRHGVALACTRRTILDANASGICKATSHNFNVAPHFIKLLVHLLADFWWQDTAVVSTKSHSIPCIASMIPFRRL